MSADTLAARIRERARRIMELVLRNDVKESDGEHWEYPEGELQALLDALTPRVTEFALSELSAAEQAARTAEREECAQIAERMNAIGADRIGDAIRNRETKPRQEPGLSHEDICRLGRVFLEHSNWGRDPQDSRIHEWLKSETVIRNRE